MLRLDTLTKDFPTYVGMSYAGWCYSYSDALGAPITEEYMNYRRRHRGSIGQKIGETAVAGEAYGGWGYSEAHLQGGISSNEHKAASRVAISSRKGTFTFGSV